MVILFNVNVMVVHIVVVEAIVYVVCFYMVHLAHFNMVVQVDLVF